MPCPTTGEATVHAPVPLARHNSSPERGSYAVTNSLPLGDELVPRPGPCDHRRRPVRLNGARRAPDLFARPFVQRDDERTLAVVIVALENHEILVEDGRTTGAHPEGADRTRACFPRQPSFEVVRVDPSEPNQAYTISPSVAGVVFANDPFR